MPHSGELVEPTSSRKIGHQVTEGDNLRILNRGIFAFPQLTQNCSCLRKLQKQKWRRAWGKGDPVTGPELGSRSRGGTKDWHYYEEHGVLKKEAYHDCLPKDLASRWKSQMKIFIPNKLTKAADPWGSHYITLYHNNSLLVDDMIGYIELFQSFCIGWNLFCDQVCGQFWRRYHQVLRRMCILLF